MRSLRRQLTASLIGAFGLILGGGGFASYWGIRELLFDQFDRGLADRARAIISAAVPRDDSFSAYFSDRFLRSFDDDVGTEYFQVFDPDGRSIQRSDSLHNENLLMRYGKPDAPAIWDLELPSGKPGRALGVEFHIPTRYRDERPSIPAIVVVAGELAPIHATLSDLRLILKVTTLAALVLTAFAVWWSLSRNLRPLRAISDEAARIDTHSLDQRLPVETLPYELQPITAKLNAILERLQASFERERRFSADLAHELRTPIAELRTLAEVALKWPEERAPETDANTLAIAEQLESRVTTLLQLARAEQGHIAIKSEWVDLVEICEIALRPHRKRAKERKLTLKLDAGDYPVPYETDPVLLNAILGNLLDNAVTYAPEGSEIALQVRPRGDTLLSVENAAPQLAEIDTERLFERFWRQDASRTESRHAGLGLSLVRSYTALLGLQITADFSAESKRLKISLKHT